MEKSIRLSKKDSKEESSQTFLADLIKDSESIHEDSEMYLRSTTKTSQGLLKRASDSKKLTKVSFRTQTRHNTCMKEKKIKSDENINKLSPIEEEMLDLRRAFSVPNSKPRGLNRKKTVRQSTPNPNKELLLQYFSGRVYSKLANPKFEAKLVQDLEGSSSQEISHFVEFLDISKMLRSSEKVSFLLVERCNLNSLTLIAKRMYNHLIPLSKEEVGSRFLCLVIEKLKIKKKQQKVLELLQSSLKALILHQYGHRVVLAVLKWFYFADCQSIVDCVYSHFYYVVESEFGYLVAVEVAGKICKKKDQQRFLNKIVNNSRKLFACRFIEPLLLKIVTEWKEESLERIVNSICDEMFELIENERGVGLVKIAIKYAPHVTI